MAAFSTKNSTIVIRMMCAILFLTFTSAYLYCYQADILTIAQHVLSGGQTHYNRTVGAILITALLFLVHWGLVSTIRLPRLFYAQTYFLPLLLLAILTNITSHIDSRFTFGAWLWIFPLLLILHSGALWWIRINLKSDDKKSPVGFFSRLMWTNMLQLVVMFFLVGLIGSGTDVFHYRAAAECDLMKGDYRSALEVGADDLPTDTSLTMIRIYALSREGLLGERLFEYPLVGESSAMLPDGNHARLMMYPSNKIYQYLGAQIRQQMRPMDYLRFLERHHLAKRPTADYLLCGYLLDRNLDEFVRALPRYYDVKGPLPKHYREALTLYTHLHSTPTIIFHDNVMDADFQDYQDMENTYKDQTVRRTKLRDTYGNTYWFYDQYGRAGERPKKR